MPHARLKAKEYKWVWKMDNVGDSNVQKAIHSTTWGQQWASAYIWGKAKQYAVIYVFQSLTSFLKSYA